MPKPPKHRPLRFALRHDRDGSRFLYAPLASEAFKARVSERDGDALPDSVVVLTAAGKLLVRSQATLHILRRSGRFWAAVAAVLRMVPRPLRDWIYDRIAAWRYKIFGRVEQACPLVAPELRERFLA